jgi:hypothetical protein
MEVNVAVELSEEQTAVVWKAAGEKVEAQKAVAETVAEERVLADEAGEEVEEATELEEASVGALSAFAHRDTELQRVSARLRLRLNCACVYGACMRVRI